MSSSVQKQITKKPRPTSGVLVHPPQFTPSSLSFSLRNTATSCPFWFWAAWAGGGWVWSGGSGVPTGRTWRRTASWVPTGRWPEGSSRRPPPCGRWRRRRRGGAWSGPHRRRRGRRRGRNWRRRRMRRWGRGRHRAAGGRRWRCAGSWATAACGRRRWPAECGTAPGRAPGSARGKCSWLPVGKGEDVRKSAMYLFIYLCIHRVAPIAL